MRLPASRLLLALPVSILLAVTLTPAHAAKAKANPWSAYFPAKGVTCTYTDEHATGATESQSTTVVVKTARKVTLRTSDEGRITWRLLSGGRLVTGASVKERGSGITARGTLRLEYPSPRKLLHHRAGHGTMTMTMRLPGWMAEEALEHGRTLTLTGDYRLAGLGSRSITLADEAGTQVDALGIRTRLRSLTITNATPRFERRLKRSLRAVFASLGNTDWVARGRGTVRSISTDDDGSLVTRTQIGCH